MKLAKEKVKKEKKISEVPIREIIVHDQDVIAAGYNIRETTQTTLSHAELIAIERANATIGSWRLEDCTLYVTIEPCPMCAGTIVQSRIKRVVFGATDPKAGCAGTIINLLQMDEFNHQVEVTGGVLKEQCQKLMKQFFKKIRNKK